MRHFFSSDQFTPRPWLFSTRGGGETLAHWAESLDKPFQGRGVHWGLDEQLKYLVLVVVGRATSHNCCSSECGGGTRIKRKAIYKSIETLFFQLIFSVSG